MPERSRRDCSPCNYLLHLGCCLVSDKTRSRRRLCAPCMYSRNDKHPHSLPEIPGQPGGKQVYELLRAPLVAVGDIEIIDRFAFEIEIRLEKREMLALEFGHDKDLVCPVDQFLGDSLRCKSVRARGLRFVLFRVAEEVLRSRAAGTGPVQTKSSLVVLHRESGTPWGARLGSVYAHLDPLRVCVRGFCLR